MNQEPNSEETLRPEESADPTSTDPGPPQRSRLLLLLRRWWIFAVAILAAFTLWNVLTWPSVGELVDQTPESSAFISAWQERNDQPANYVTRSYSQISPTLKKAVLVAEDINFFHHNGFETEELKKAVRETLSEGKKLRGASTLTQQLAKNLWLSPSRNPLRKVKEALLTRQLERQLSKRRILELYLNVVEFGPGQFGAEAASRHYFGKSAQHLTTSEAASLAASLPHSKWYPGRDSKSYQAHVRRIEQRMKQADWLDGSL